MALGDSTDQIQTLSQPAIMTPGGDITDSGNLGDPTPRVLARQVPSSTSRGQQQLGGPNVIADSDNQRFLILNDGIPRVIIGKKPSGKFGVLTSQDGYDVETATPSQMSFDSDFNVFKIIKTGTVSLTSTGFATGASPVTAAVNYADLNLDFAPGVIAYTDDGIYRQPLPYSLYDITTGAIRNRIYAQITKTETLFVYQDWSGEPARTYTIRYYLLLESAS